MNNKETADKMFEELGYEKKYEGNLKYKDEKYVEYHNKFYNSTIQIWNDKTISKYDNLDEVGFIDLDELKAINKKVEELEWI